MLRTGGRWRDVPADNGPATTVYNRSNRWSGRDFWRAMLAALAEAGWIAQTAAIDSTYIKAHRCAHGGKPGDACSMAAGGIVRVLGSMSDAGTLVSYRPPATASPGVVDGCADGTVAFVPTGRLFNWPSVGSALAERHEVGARLTAAADRVLSGLGTD